MANILIAKPDGLAISGGTDYRQIDSWRNEGGHLRDVSPYPAELPSEEQAGWEAVDVIAARLNADVAAGLVGAHHNTYQHRSRILREMIAELEAMASSRMAGCETSATRSGLPGDASAARSGRMVKTPSGEKPYNAILEYEQGADSVHPFGTMREGEAFIRDQSPAPLTRDTSWDRPSSTPKGS